MDPPDVVLKDLRVKEELKRERLRHDVVEEELLEHLGKLKVLLTRIDNCAVCAAIGDPMEICSNILEMLKDRSLWHVDRCLICGKPVPEYIPELCCNGFECGCMGQPTNPCICSDSCHAALFAGISGTMEERRKAAGIDKWTGDWAEL